MLIRVEYSVSGLLLDGLGEEARAIQLSGHPAISVSFRRPSEEEKALGHKADLVICAAETDRQPNERVAAGFRALAQGKVPGGAVQGAEEEWDWYLDDSGAIRPDRTPRTGLLPQPMQSFLNDSWRQLGEAIRRTVQVLRWRWARAGRNSVFAVRVGKSVWSFDGREWYPLPTDIHVEVLEGQSGLRLTQPVLEELEDLLEAGVVEPLPHQLHREAWELRTSNSRSSLVIGVAALEVGLKQLISAVIPQAQWLTENVPSPPVVSMLRDYLPSLPVKLQIAGKVPTLGKPVLDTLTKIISARNKVTHVGASPLGGDSLDDALLLIRDLLWLFDYYGGHEWALTHIRASFRRDLIGEGGV